MIMEQKGQERTSVGRIEIVKNEKGALPIGGEVKSVGLMGVHSYRLLVSEKSGVVSGYGSLAESFRAAGFVVNGRGVETYEAYAAKRKNRLKAPGSCCIWPKRRMAYAEFPFFSEDLVENVVDFSDAVIVTLGRELCAGEEVRMEEGAYYLSRAEHELLRMVSARCEVKEKRLIVVLNTAYDVETESWSSFADAIVKIGLPKQAEVGEIVKELKG